MRTLLYQIWSARHAAQLHKSWKLFRFCPKWLSPAHMAKPAHLAIPESRWPAQSKSSTQAQQYTGGIRMITPLLLDGSAPAEDLSAVVRRPTWLNAVDSW
jgi:hypothetical protein